MMRILWDSCAPWVGSGYGSQTALWARYLADQGHDVAISSYYNGDRQDAVWEDITVYPPPAEGPVHANLAENAEAWKADVIVVLADIWTMNFTNLGFNAGDGHPPILCWTPIDTTPLSIADTYIFKTQDVIPVAMSEHGREQFDKAGIRAAYVPHAIDTEAWKPDPMRRDLRLAYGIPTGQFAVGMNFNNIDPVRKATPEQWNAYARFRQKVPDSMLFAHTRAQVDNSLDLHVLARTLRITDNVRFADQERVHTGGFTQPEMARFYSAMDVVLNCTYGEGFGLPALEAQACGTPVIVADNTTGRQLRGPGWLASTEPWWNAVHQSWWARPSIASIHRALNLAWIDKSPFKREACRHFAGQYDIRVIGPMWLELLEQTGAGFTP